MWIIKKADKIIGDWDSCENDILSMEFCLFRGPNAIIWYHFYPTEDLSLLSKDSEPFSLVLSDGKGGYEFTVRTRLDTIGWDNTLSCAVIRLIPDTFYALLNPIVFSNKAVKNIEDALKGMLGSNVKVVVSNDVKQMSLYKGYFHRGRIIDALAKFCADNDREFYANDTTVAVGLIEKSTNAGDIPSLNNKQNTLFEFTKYNKKFMVCVLDSGVQMPGSIIKVQNEDRRILYTKIYCQSTQVTSTVLTIEREIKITEYMLAGLLDKMNKDQLLNNVLRRNLASFVGKTHTDEEFTKEILTFNAKRDMEDLIFETNTTPIRVVKSSPYAGDEVGLQFPLNSDAMSVITTHEGERSAGIEISQLWQKETAPTRGETKDFRLTLPDGGSIYYDDSEGEWIFSAKTKIRLGVESGVSHSSVPNPDKYFEIDGTGDTMTISQNGAKIEIDGSGNITIDSKSGSNVNINGTSPAAARKGDSTKSTITEDPSFWGAWEAFFTAVGTGPLPEPGNGAPSVFQTALIALASAMQSTLTGKITGGSTKTNIG